MLGGACIGPHFTLEICIFLQSSLENDIYWREIKQFKLLWIKVNVDDLKIGKIEENHVF